MKLNARSSISPSHPNLEQSILAIELQNQNQFTPETKRRKKSVRFALDNPRMPPPRTPKVRSKKRLIRFEDHPGLSQLEIGALRAARIMSMPSPPKFGAPDYDSDSSDDEEDTINFMSRRPTRMKPAQVSAPPPPTERSSGNVFARNGNIFAPIQASSQVQAWPVGSYKAAMAAERAKKAEEKARREETARKEAEQKSQDENAKIDAEEEATVIEMLESSPMQLSEELPEALTNAPQDALDETPAEAPQQSSNEQSDDVPEPVTAAPVSLSSSPPPPPPPGSHLPLGAAPEAQLHPARHSEQALAEESITKQTAEEFEVTEVTEDTKDTEVNEVTEDEDEWILVDTPADQHLSTSSNQPRRSPTIPQVIQRVTRSMSKGIQAKLRVVSGESKTKSIPRASNASRASRGVAKARQMLTKTKSVTEMTRTKTRTVSAAESRAQTMPAIAKVRRAVIGDVKLALTVPKSPSVSEPQPIALSSKPNQLKRRWEADDVQESSSKKRKFSGQERPAKKAKLSATTQVSVVVPQGPTVPTPQEVVSVPCVSGKRRRDDNEEEPSSIGARLVKRLRKL